MEIKNEALKSLYEELISGVWSFCPCTKDDIDAAFKKCDDELEKEKEKLMKDLEDNVLAYYKIKQLEGENEELRKKCTYFEKLSTERLKATEELHQQLDTAEKEREAIREESLRNIREGYKTECDLKELRQKYDYLERSHKRLGDIRNRLAKENEDLKQQLDDIGKNYREAVKRVCELVREKVDLRKQLDSLNTAMGRLRERYEEEVVCRRKWAKLAGYRAKRIEELLKTGYGIDVDEVYKLEGMEELWAMLGEMYAADPIEVTKIFGWFSINNIAHYTPDVKDFLEKYKTWKSGKENSEEEKKRLAEMRDYLDRFCLGKVCYGCPLNTPEFKCYGHGGFESISDEDLQRYYEKARGCGRFPWADKKEEKPSDEVPCSFNWKLDGTEFTIETSIPRKDYDNIVKIISGKE